MRSKLKRNALLEGFLLLLLPIAAHAFNFKEVRVTPSSYTTNVTTSYTVFFDRTITNSFTTTAFASTPLNSSSTVTLTFPLQYTLTSNITCSYQINSTGSYVSTSCTQLNNQITISGIFNNNTILASITLLIGNVLNPYPAGRTSNFTGTIGVNVAVPNGIGSLVTITSATASCSFTFNPNLVYSTQSMVFTITLTNQFPSGGTIVAQFPQSRLWSQQLDSSRLLPISSSMVCSSQSANVNSAIQCTGSNTFATVTFSNIVSTSLISGTTLSFAINSFYSPPTNQPADVVVLTTYTGSSSIDTCNSYVTGLTAKTIPSTQFFITEKNQNPFVVNKLYTIKFQITTLDIISLTDYFVITFPEGTSINNFAVSEAGGTLSYKQTSTYYNQVLTLYLDGTGTLQPQSLFVFIPNFVAPPSTLTTNNFQLQIMSNNFPKMVSFQTIQATTGALTGTATMSTTTVNAVANYRFSITISNPITSGGFMKMILPSILTVANSTTCAVITGTSMNSIPTCAMNSIDSSITFTNLNSSTSTIPAQTFTLVLSNVKNPPSTKTTDAFTLSTYYNSSSSAGVDAGSIGGVTATPATIDYTKISVLSSSLITSGTTVTYYFSFVVQDPIPAGGFIIVYFPTTITFNLVVANNNCQIMINSSTAVTTPCTASQGSNSYIFNFTNPISSAPATTNTNLTLSILNAATNPPTTQPVSPFSVQTFHSDGTSIASAYNVSSYSQIQTPSAFTLNQISKVSNKNGELTSFTVILSQIAALEPNAVIRVTFPSSVTPQPTSTCSITYLGVSRSAACGLSGSTFKIISISDTIAAGITFSITFTNIQNAFSFSPISGFQVSTKTATDLYQYSSSSSTNSISNSVPSQFSSLSSIYTPLQLNTSVSLQLTFQLSQASVMPSYFQISIDTYFTMGTLSCLATSFPAICSSIATNTLRVTGSFNGTTVRLTITGFFSPNAAPSAPSYSILNSFDASGYKIDESSNNITFSLGCVLPCMTCSSTNASSCQSCYSTTQVTPSVYFHSASSNCYTICPATTYNNNVSLVCSPCDSNCLTCSGSPTFCTKCIINSTFPFLSITNTTQSCISSCGVGYYGDKTLDPATCVICKSPCATCTAADVCLTCVSGYFYEGNKTCTTVCTANTTVANNATNICDPCSSICLTCSGTINTCTACNSPLVFYGGSCQTSCPAGGALVPFNGICTACVSSCLTCSQTISNCTSCNLNSTFLYFMNNQCISSCPVFYYNVSTSGSCVSCASANINCNNCSSSTTCYSCDTPFVLNDSKCLSSVPLGYVNISGVAVKCSGDCATCEVSTTNCTTCTTLNLQSYACVANCSVGTIPVSKVCVPCISPCATCSVSQYNCTSCLTNLSPSMFLNINTCQATCPDLTYPNGSTFTCTACTNNCLLCSSATVCISCSNSTNLYNTSCIASCPAGFVGISNVCQACTANCKTCVGGTNICLTCLSGFYFLNSTQTCSSSCSTGLFIDFLSQSCVGCNTTCKTCANTSSTCTSCPSSTFLYNFQCLSSCPTGLFQSGGTCLSCPTNCSSCSAFANCSACSGANYLHNGQCLSSCPASSGYIVNGVCSPCTAQQCFSCTSTNVCLSCNAGYLFLNSLCLGTCPSGYNSNGTHCIDVLANSLSSSIESPNNSFPVPFTIAGIVLIIACLMSRLQFQETYLSGAIYSFISILEWGALCLFLYLYSVQHMSEPVAAYIGFGALGFLYIMNIAATIAHSIFLCYEKEFVDWTARSKFNKCFYYFTNAMGLVANHKFKNILFCKLFTFKVFCAKLDKVDHFRIFNIFSLVSLIHSGAAIFAAGIALTKTNNKQQLFHQCLDVIILTSLNIVMSFFNTHKDKTFFEEYTPEGFSLHKKNSIIEEHLVGSKFNEIGEDGEVEEGYNTGFNHALTSKHALKFDKISQESLAEVGGGLYSDSSMAEITEKGYESASEKNYQEISVQAYDLIDEKVNITAKTSVAPKAIFEDISIQADQLIHQEEQRGINLSELPPQGFQNDTSNFTNYEYFKKVDQSVQGHLDRGINYSAQMQIEQMDQSIQNDNRLGDMVDFSIQKYEEVSHKDFSIQKDEPHRKDASLQYSNRQQDQSVSMTQRSRSMGVQQQQTITNKSISAYVSMRNQSNQLSEVSQEDEENQVEPSVYEQGIQPTIEFEDEAIQPDIEYEDYAIQPDIQYNEIAVQPTLDPSANEIAVQYEMEPVNYNQFEEELAHSNTASNMLFETTEVDQQGEPQRQLVEERAEELEVPNHNIRSYQEELEERIRNKEKELMEIKRKIEFKERMNQRKKQDLEQQRMEEQNVNLAPIKYVEQRPQVLPLRPSQHSSRTEEIRPSSSGSSMLEEIQVKRGPEESKQIHLEIQSKEIPKEKPIVVGQRVEPEIQNASRLSSDRSAPLNQTMEEIKVMKEPLQETNPIKGNFSRRQKTIEQVNISKAVTVEREPSQVESNHYSKREKTIQEINLIKAPSVRDNTSQVQSKSSRQKTIQEIRREEPKREVRKQQVQKKHIEFKQNDHELLSDQSEEIPNQFVRTNQQPSPIKQEKPSPTKQHIQPDRQVPERQRREKFTYRQESSPYREQSVKGQAKSSSSKQQSPKRQTRQIIRQTNQVPTRQEMPAHIQIRDMGDVELGTTSHKDNIFNIEQSQGESYREPQEAEVSQRESQATRKNVYDSNKKQVVIDVTEIDRSLKGEEEENIELQQSHSSGRQPTGIVNAFHNKPTFRNNSPSELSGTIEEIPRHYDHVAIDNEKTLTNNNESPKQRQPARPQVQIDQQKLANYFTGSMGTVNEKSKGHLMPAESDHEPYRINKLYSNDSKNKVVEPLPRNTQREREKKNSTLALAGKAQFTQDKLLQRKPAPQNPLNIQRQWEAQHEDKYISEDDDFTPTNRNNLVRKPPTKNTQNFASHLVLPQESDRQNTSFQGKKEERAPMSGKLREVRPLPKKELEEIEVHFQSDQLEHDLSVRDKNRSPEFPRANRDMIHLREEDLYEQESEDVDYRKMMILGQMQDRPGNADLQDYYNKRGSKEKGRRSNNKKVDRSTQKIYMQKLDKGKR